MQELQDWMQNSGERGGPYDDDTRYLGRSDVAGSSLWRYGSRTASGLDTSSAASFTNRYELPADGWDDSDEWNGSVVFARYFEFTNGGAAGAFAKL
jgi:hypothetical protein